MFMRVVKYQPQHAAPSPDKLNCIGWYMMEKFSGQRVFWNDKELQGATMEISVPLPTISFEAILSRDRKKLMAFDAPLMYGESYEERLQFLTNNIPHHHPLVKVITPIKIASQDQLQCEHSRVIERGGEGIMLRKPGSKYMEPNTFYNHEVRDEFVWIVPLILLRETQRNYPHQLTSISTLQM